MTDLQTRLLLDVLYQVQSCIEACAPDEPSNYAKVNELENLSKRISIFEQSLVEGRNE